MEKVLITGGTGSFGRGFVKYITENRPEVKRLVIFSRDEMKQWEMRQDFPEDKFPQLRFFLGDIRDRERLKRSLENIDTVVHAAALKQVPAAEYNPIEFINTNVLGSENVVHACIEAGVKTVIALSTDKAAAPVNLYGATKLCADKLFVAANNIHGGRELKFSVVRYGNVMGSRGSVIPLFMKTAREEGLIRITDRRMTRFNITLQEGVKMVTWAIDEAKGGEILVPKIPSYRITEVAEAIGPNCKQVVTGIRPGEKIHEEMITTADSYLTHETEKYYLILPGYGKTKEMYENDSSMKIKKVERGFAYSSGNNKDFLNKEQIRDLITRNIDKNFKPL